MKQTKLEIYKEKVLSQETQFQIGSMLFVKYKFDNHTRIYSMELYGDMLSVYRERKFELSSIVHNETIYLLSDYKLREFKNGEEEALLDGVTSFHSKLIQVNEYISNVVVPQFYDLLEDVELSQEEKEHVQSGMREKVINGEHRITAPNQIYTTLFKEEHLTKLLDDKLNVDDYVLQYLDDNKEKLKTQKAINKYTLELFNANYGLEQWELDLVNGLNSVEGKTVNVTFVVNGVEDSAKMELDRLKRNIRDSNSSFSSWEFATRPIGEGLFEKLNIGYKEGQEKLYSKHISKVTFGKKVLFER